VMLLDEIQEFKVFLLGSYSKATADTYCKRLATLLAGQPLTHTAERLDIPLLLEKLGDIKHKNYFSQTKNALLHFCTFKGVTLPHDTLASIGKLQSTTKKKYRKLKPIEFTEVDKKIKHLRNMKLKLSYQAIIATGLRVSELSSLSQEDCTVSDDEITFSFIGKGGKHGEVVISVSEHPLLHERINALVEDATLCDKSGDGEANNKLFYSAGYLQSKAKEMGFSCHDLRRAYAKIEYKKCKNKTEVSEKLRHSNTRTTNIYLRSKVRL